MKKITSTLFVILAFAGLAFANKYEKVMSDAIQKLYSAQEIQNYMDAIAIFERIGVNETEEWLPMYYAGLGYIWASHTTQNGQEIDSYLDKAQLFVDRANKLSPDNDEIVTLQGYIYMMKIVVDPATRGQELSGVAMQTFGRAIGMNKNNPRALMLMGRMQMGTDHFFGNDTSASCGMIIKSLDLFEAQNPDSALSPTWGKEIAQGLLTDCSSN